MRVLLILTVVVFGALIAVGIAVSWRRVPDEVEDPSVVAIGIPEGFWYGGSPFGRFVDITADGRKIVFVAREHNRRSRLYLQTIGEPTPREIHNTEFAHDPTFSPDGRFLAFYADESIKKADLATGAVTTVGPANDMRGIVWLDSETFILGNASGGLLRIRSSEPQPVPLFEYTGPQMAHLHPEILPDKRTVLFTMAIGGLTNARVWMADLKTGQERLLIEQNSFNPRYASSGHIVFASGPARKLFAAAFDLKKVEILGSPQLVLDTSIAGRGSGGSTDFAFSTDGTLFYAPRREESVDGALAEVFADTSLMEMNVRLNWFEELKRLAPAGYTR